MGPRARARGNGGLRRGYIDLRYASMGPRARARGNLSCTYAGVWVLVLQWGHERALVEIARDAMGQPNQGQLQWGHERALVEIALRAADGNRHDGLQWGHERALVEITWWERVCWFWFGFNGATSARSWKSRRRIRHIARAKASMGPRARARGNGAVKLAGGGADRASMGPRARARGNWRERALQQRVGGASMGPRARARGNRLHLRNLAAQARASMGPRARARGNRRLAVERRRHDPGFNGATSARSWKYNIPEGVYTVSYYASMGPRARARGNPMASRSVPSSDRLQWGHERALVEIFRGKVSDMTLDGLQQYSEATISRRPAVQRPVTAADLGRVPASGAERLLGNRRVASDPVGSFALPSVTESQGRISPSTPQQVSLRSSPFNDY